MRALWLIPVSILLAACPGTGYRPPPVVTPPVTPPAVVTPAAPTEMSIHVQVQDGPTWTGIAGAKVEVIVSAASWVTGMTDAGGHVVLSVPSGLTESHVRVSAPGRVSYDQHADVYRDVTITVALEAEHKGWPPADRWPKFACDLDGVRVPSIRAFGQTDSVFSIILPVYPPAVRAEILAAHKARGYTHFVLDPRPKYPPWYPSGDFSQPAQFRAVLHEVLDAGLMPVVFFDADTDTSMSPDVALAQFKRQNDPILTDAETMSLIKLAVPGWEANDHISVSAYEVIARYLRSRLNADALLYVHMTPYHAAMCEGDGCESAWWRRMANDNVVNGILYQHQITDSVEAYKDRVKDFTDRLVFGMNGWPTRTGKGDPLRVIVFEYDAYWQTRNQRQEADGFAWGDIAMTIPGVSGYCDGGTVRIK